MPGPVRYVGGIVALCTSLISSDLEASSRVLLLMQLSVSKQITCRQWFHT